MHSKTKFLFLIKDTLQIDYFIIKNLENAQIKISHLILYSKKLNCSNLRMYNQSYKQHKHFLVLYPF